MGINLCINTPCMLSLGASIKFIESIEAKSDVKLFRKPIGMSDVIIFKQCRTVQGGFARALELVFTTGCYYCNVVFSRSKVI